MITVALVDDYDVVLLGVAHMLDATGTGCVVAEIDTNEPSTTTWTSCCTTPSPNPNPTTTRSPSWSTNPRARRVVVYTWNFHPDLIDSARRQGVHGYLSKTLPARELVAALEAVHAGEIVVSDPPPRARSDTGWTGPVAARASPIARQRSWR